MPKFTEIFNTQNQYSEYEQVGNLIDKTTGVIPDNQWANVMRCSMENKNLLAKKGALYIGTGDTTELTVPGEGNDGKQQVAITDVLLPGEENEFLSVGPDDTANQKLRYRKLLESDIPDISYTKIKDNIPFTKISGFPTKVENVEATDDYWQSSSEEAPGKYRHSIDFSEGINKSPIVQLMMQQGSVFTIVNSTIEVNGTNITVYSNIQFKGKILIMGI